MAIEIHNRLTREPWRRCECCTHVDMKQRPDLEGGYAVGCLHPRALYGQAGKGKTCSGFEREIGSDDDLDQLPPLVNY